MKLPQKLNPKNLFRTATKKTRTITRSTSSSSSSSLTNPTTPKSVLPSRRELELLLTRIGPDPLSEEDLQMLVDQEIDDGFIEKFGEVSSVHDLRDAFDYFDADKDGKISAQELLEALASIGDTGCTLDDCSRMIAGVDNDGDGLVCFQDFSRMMECKFPESN